MPLTTTSPAAASDYQDIWGVIEDLSERYQHPTFVIDPEAGGEQLAQQIDAELDATVIEHSQKPLPMSLAAQRLSEAISERRIRHRGDPDLTRARARRFPQAGGGGMALREAQASLGCDRRCNRVGNGRLDRRRRQRAARSHARLHVRRTTFMPQTPRNLLAEPCGFEDWGAQQTRTVASDRSGPSSRVQTVGTALQAGGHRFDPGTLHSGKRCKSM
jgi:hypothetical protein